MKNLKSTITALFFLIIYHSGYTQTQFEQVLLSETWTGQGGESALFYQNVTKTDASNNVYVAGSKITIVDVMGRTVLEKNIYNVMDGGAEQS